MTFTRIGKLLSMRNIHLVGRRRQRINSTFALRFRTGCGQGVNWEGNNPAKLQGVKGWSGPQGGRGEASRSRGSPVIIIQDRFRDFEYLGMAG